MELPSWVIPLVSILFGAGGPIAAYVAWRSESKKAPIERSAAKTAEAVAISSAANELVETILGRMTIQDSKIDLQDAKIQELRAELRDTNTRLDVIQLAWKSWYIDLKESWDSLRTKDNAPPPPLV